MVGSQVDDDHRVVSVDDSGGCCGAGEPLSPDPSSFVSCSICLDAVLNDGQRSWAKLKCGHEFHLDCIGSAFNVKRAMQCPNCRKIEKGRWLYANEVADSVPEYSVNDWIPDQEPYELAFPELRFRAHWCPFNGLTRYRSELEDLDPPSTMYQGLPEHGPFAEHTAASTVSHSYVTYIGQPPPSNASDNLEEPVLNHHWNVVTPGEIPVPHGFPTMDFQYQSWIHRSLPTSGHMDGIDHSLNSTSVMRSAREESMTRSASSTHALLLGQGSGARSVGPFIQSVVQLPSNRSHERIMPSPPVFQQSSTAPVIAPVQHSRRYFIGRRPSVISTPLSHPDHNGPFFFMHPPAAIQNPHEALHPVPSQMYPWDRFPASMHDSMDLNWPPLHQAAGRPESGSTRSSSVWQRHWS